MRRMTIPAINLIARLSVLFVIGLASSIADAQPATRVLEDFLEENRCSSNINENKKCLTALTNKACSSGCMRRGYNWTEDATNPTLRSRLDLHMTTPYLKLVRNAVIEAPWYTLRNGLSFGYTLEQLLYHQVQMFLIDDSTRYHSATMAPLSQAAVKSGSHTVDPTRFWMVAFGNDVGAAQSMGQGDFALWLLTMAKSWASVGRGDKIDYYLRLSQAAFRTFLVRVEEGGVRNNKRSYRCYGTQYCYWFHSGNEQVEWPQSVLNKNLNAIRNVLWAHAQLAEWRNSPISRVALPNEFATNGHIEQLRELGRGGLNQLAYGLGHGGPDHPVDYSAPPNLWEFMQNSQPDPGHPSVKRYNSWYRFDMPKHLAGNGSTAGNVCHYHYYTLQLFRQILTEISANPYYSSDRDFIALYYKLLYGRSEGDTRTCNNRGYIPPSKKVMRGLPLAEFYYFGKIFPSWPNASPFPGGHCDDALWFHLPNWFTNNPPKDPDAPGIIETRRFFDTAYQGCAF